MINLVKADVITLIADTPAAHEVFASPTETRTQVFAEIRSVGMTEAYTAMSQGLNPSFVFVLQLAEDYSGQHRLEYKSELYKVVRTYMAGDGIELVAERMASDV